METEFVWRMEDVLDLYEEPHDERWPVACFDETPCRLEAEARPPRPNREARRATTTSTSAAANVFALFEPKGCWRRLEVTERRTASDFAEQTRRLADEHCPKAEKVRVVKAARKHAKAPRSPLLDRDPRPLLLGTARILLHDFPPERCT